MNRRKATLIMILAIALLLRLAPVVLYDMPISYDAPFHINESNEIISQKTYFSASQQSDLPHNYPPFYHLLLASLSLVLGLPVFVIAMVLLPLLSVLVCLAVFVLVRKIAGEKNALFSAFLVAVASPLITAAYDSPENAMFFILPLVLFLFYKKRDLFATLLYVSSVFWNYFIFLATILPMLLTYLKKMKNFAVAVFSVVLILLFYSVTKGMRFFNFGGIDSGMSFVVFNLRNAIPALVFLGAIFAIPLAYFVMKHKNKGEIKFWFYWKLLSFLLLLSIFITPLLRAWEQLKFIALSIAVLVGAMLNNRKVFRIFVFVLVAVLFTTSLLVSFQLLFPRINSLDTNAIDYLKTLDLRTEDRILAAPSFSEYIKLYSDLQPHLITHLYFERAASESMFNDALYSLMPVSSQEETQDFLEASNTRYFIFNFEDSAVRGLAKFDEMPAVNKVYSLKYHQPCPFPFLGKEISYSCWDNETGVYNLAKDI